MLARRVLVAYRVGELGTRFMTYQIVYTGFLARTHIVNFELGC
jgi:hypothetical protein